MSIVVSVQTAGAAAKTDNVVLAFALEPPCKSLSSSFTCSSTSFVLSFPSFILENNEVFPHSLSPARTLSPPPCPPSLALLHPFSVPPSLFNKLRLHLPQCCSRLFGRPDGPVAQCRRLNAARRAHWLHCAFDEALHLSPSRAGVCDCVYV